MPLRTKLISYLRSIYLVLFPIETKRYQFIHALLRNILIHFRPFNIRYQFWIKQFDIIGENEFSFYQAKAKSCKDQPLISILMPVYNPNISHFTQAIQSVKDQIYQHWELCIADDASTDPKVREIIRNYSVEDKRIRPVFRDENGHISAASNSALSAATGDFCALLDHDDMLHPLALFWVVHTINDFPDCEVIYSDEDKITSSGKRIEPYFKSDFNYELLLSQNMVSHLGVYRTSTLHHIGGFRLGLEGSQDYDLLLRVLECIDQKQIHHIPRVLYHWRISKRSVASRVDIKPYALEAGNKALTDHLNNISLDATVEPYRKYGYQVHHNIPDPSPTVELIIPPNNNLTDIINCINLCLSTTNYNKLSVICYDLDQEFNQLKSHFTDSRVNVTIPVNQGKDLINQQINDSSADVIVIASDQIIGFSKTWLEKLIGLIWLDDIGAVSPQLLSNNGLIFSSGIVFGVDGIARHIFNGILKNGPDAYFGWASLNKGYSALPAGCLLVKRETFLSVGGLNQSLSNHTARIIDFCLKLKVKGLRNVMVPDVQVSLDLSKKAKHLDHEIILNSADQDYFLTYWQEILKRDPAFNPNLTIINGKPNVSKSPQLDTHVIIP